MKTTKYLILLLVILSTAMLFAEDIEDHELKKALGLHFGTASGNGYSYRLMFGDKSEHSLQFVFGAMTTGDNDVDFDERVYIYDTSAENEKTLKGRKTSSSIGITYMNTLVKTGYTRFYFLWGGSYLYSRRNEFTQKYLKDGSSYYYNASGDPVKVKKNKDRWTLGVGPGFELFADKNLRVSLEIPITINNKSEVVPYIPQIGVYYYFD